MPVLTVQHVTTYKYRRPVGFGEHRMMFRPRDSVDQRIVSWNVVITPAPISLRSIPDSFGNILTLARFGQRGRELHVENQLVVDHRATRPDEIHVAPYARIWPFTYDLDDAADLARVMQRHYPDPERRVDAWARGFLTASTAPTFDLLVAMTYAIRRDFTYCARYEEGVQEPSRTLALRAGTCRDFAILMIEAVRSLGMAARFVTGYIYSPAVEGKINQGGGATHAWVEVFVPGAGWIDFDPTNGIIGSRDLIRVASVRDAHQAVPLSGTWTGFPADSIGMSVCVHVTADEKSGPVPVGGVNTLEATVRATEASCEASAALTGPGIVQLASREKTVSQLTGGKPVENYAGGKPVENYAGGKPVENYAGGKPVENHAGGRPVETLPEPIRSAVGEP